jgi:hypothetical protein
MREKVRTVAESARDSLTVPDWQPQSVGDPRDVKDGIDAARSFF